MAMAATPASRRSTFALPAVGRSIEKRREYQALNIIKSPRPPRAALSDHAPTRPIQLPGRTVLALAAAGAMALSTHAASAQAAPDGDGVGTDGLYVGVGVANLKSSATAGGNFVENESKYSVAGRFAVGYEAALAPQWRLGGEIYALPQARPLGLGDHIRQVWGLALMPALALGPDTTVFVGLGYEQAKTNSPVSRWTQFDVDTPVLSAGLRHSLAAVLHVPVSIGLRYEYAQYQKIAFAGQSDRIKQERLSVSADYRF